MSQRSIALAAATVYLSAMIGLVGGIGVMAAGGPIKHETAGHEVGFALIMILGK